MFNNSGGQPNQPNTGNIFNRNQPNAQGTGVGGFNSGTQPSMFANQASKDPLSNNPANTANNYNNVMSVLTGGSKDNTSQPTSFFNKNNAANIGNPTPPGGSFGAPTSFFPNIGQPTAGNLGATSTNPNQNATTENRPNIFNNSANNSNTSFFNTSNTATNNANAPNTANTNTAITGNILGNTNNPLTANNSFANNAGTANNLFNNANNANSSNTTPSFFTGNNPQPSTGTSANQPTSFGLSGQQPQNTTTNDPSPNVPTENANTATQANTNLPPPNSPIGASSVPTSGVFGGIKAPAANPLNPNPGTQPTSNPVTGGGTSFFMASSQPTNPAAQPSANTAGSPNILPQAQNSSNPQPQNQPPQDPAPQAATGGVTINSKPAIKDQIQIEFQRSNQTVGEFINDIKNNFLLAYQDLQKMTDSTIRYLDQQDENRRILENFTLLEPIIKSQAVSTSSTLDLIEQKQDEIEKVVAMMQSKLGHVSYPHQITKQLQQLYIMSEQMLRIQDTFAVDEEDIVPENQELNQMFISLNRIELQVKEMTTQLNRYITQLNRDPR